MEKIRIIFWLLMAFGNTYCFFFEFFVIHMRSELLVWNGIASVLSFYRLWVLFLTDNKMKNENN